MQPWINSSRLPVLKWSRRQFFHIYLGNCLVLHASVCPFEGNSISIKMNSAEIDISTMEWGWMSSYSSYYLQKVVNTFHGISSSIPRFCVRCFSFKLFWRPEDPVQNYYTVNLRSMWVTNVTMTNVIDAYIFFKSCSKSRVCESKAPDEATNK